MEDTKFQVTLVKRLNTLISLMLEVASPDETASTTKKVERLISFGLSPAEVGEILGKPTNYISAVMHKKKKKTKKKS